MRAALLRTAVFNYVMTAFAGGSGIVIARSLGPTGRGQYAELVSWYGVALVVGEIGQTAAVVYFVARAAEDAPAYVATGQRILMGASLVMAAALCGVAFLFERADVDLLYGFVFLALALPVSFVGAAYISAAQARKLGLWNWLRFSQPASFFCMVIAGWRLDRLSPASLMAALALSTAIQVVIARHFVGRLGLIGGRPTRLHARAMLRYGTANLASALPFSISRQADLLALTMVATAGAVGRYSVAVSYVMLCFPLAGAVGSAVFPAQARAGRADGRIVSQAVRGVLVMTSVACGLLIAISMWLVPFLYGARFAPSVTLTYWLVPATIALSLNQVCGDLLRGKGKPRLVAASSWTGLISMLASLAVLVPIWGARGAATASALGQVSALFVLAFYLRRTRRQETGSR